MDFPVSPMSQKPVFDSRLLRSVVGATGGSNTSTQNRDQPKKKKVELVPKREEM